MGVVKVLLLTLFPLQHCSKGSGRLGNRPPCFQLNNGVSFSFLFLSVDVVHCVACQRVRPMWWGIRLEGIKDFKNTYCLDIFTKNTLWHLWVIKHFSALAVVMLKLILITVYQPWYPVAWRILVGFLNQLEGHSLSQTGWTQLEGGHYASVVMPWWCRGRGQRSSSAERRRWARQCGGHTPGLKCTKSTWDPIGKQRTEKLGRLGASLPSPFRNTLLLYIFTLLTCGI